MPADQKRAPDPITDGCEPPCGCWELNSGPLEEQAMLLTSEPSLQPPNKVFKTESYLCECLACMNVCIHPSTQGQKVSGLLEVEFTRWLLTSHLVR